MLQILHRAADVGECAATVERVGDGGSGDDRHREWAPPVRGRRARGRGLMAAAELMDPPVRALEIPFEGTALPALLATPAGGGPRATIVHVNGYDSTVYESFFALGPAAVARGQNLLCFDGPGQGPPLVRDGITMRPDWENVVRPAIDHVLAGVSCPAFLSAA